MVCGNSLRMIGSYPRVSHISQLHDTLNHEPLQEFVHPLSAKYLLTLHPIPNPLFNRSEIAPQST